VRVYLCQFVRVCGSLRVYTEVYGNLEWEICDICVCV